MKNKKKLLTVFILFIILVVSLRIFIGEPCQVPSASMEPTIMSGDWLWIDKTTYGGILPTRFADIPLINIFTLIPFLRKADLKNNWGYHRFYSFSEPSIGDVVVFRNPDNKGGLLVKRIKTIISKGDSIITNNKESHDLLKDILLKEGKSRNLSEEYVFINNSHSPYYIVPQNYYYMIGDNYNNSSDSRDYGYIPEKNIVGKINRVLFSINEEDGYRFRKERFFYNIR
ncbi:MAG: signal peptidase I [Dysgonomonas sp.]